MHKYMSKITSQEECFMYDLQYWRSHTDRIATLSEEDRRTVLAELHAEDLRNHERGSYDLITLDNEQKLRLLQRWYPRAYSTVEKFYPGFVQEPNNFPPIIANAINSLICHFISGVDREIAFI